MAEKLKLNPHRPTRNLSNQNISHNGWSSLVHFGEWIIGRGTWRKSTETIEKYVNSGTIGRRVNVYQYSKDMITLVIMYYNIITFKIITHRNDFNDTIYFSKKIIFLLKY